MEENAGYKKIIAWQKADELTMLLYQVTNNFPKMELYVLTSQIRRAALSVPTNIVEGYARNSKPEFKRFIVIALGSLAEVKYLLSVAFRLKYLSEINYQPILQLTEETGKLLWSFYRSL